MADTGDVKLECANLNTTECILLAATSILAEAKKTGDEFNWDPASFAVTLIIGLVALFFAALTIGQGLMAAAGKTCSRYALGPWAHFSKKRVDWSEMRAHATAKTPIIRIRRVVSLLSQFEDAGPEQYKDDKTDSALAEEDPIEPRAAYPPPKPREEYFPATWLALLTSVGLDHPGIWLTKTTRTDYLPADLVAAPAYASIRDMVTLAALAAFPTLSRLQLVFESESVLGSVHHEDFDLDFRQHPSIGMHGVFQTFNTISRKWDVIYTTRRNAQMPSRAMLTVILNAHGHIPQKPGFDYDRQNVVREIDGSRISENWAAKESVREIPRLDRLGASSACTGLNHGSSESCLQVSPLCHCLCRHGDEGFASTVARGAGRAQIYGIGGSWVLLMAEVPSNHPTLFPKRAKKLTERVWNLLPLSRFWSLQADQSNVGCSGLPIGSFVPRNEQVKACRQYLRDIDSGTVFELQPDSGLLEELNRLDLYLETIRPEVLSCRMLCLGSAAMICGASALLKWTLASEDHDLFPWSRARAKDDTADEPRIPMNFSSEASRGRITDVLVTLKAFLSWYREDPHRVGDDGVQRGRRIPGYVADFRFGCDAYGAIAEELDKVLKIWEVGENGEFSYDGVQVQHPVDDLLVYRAIMMAMLYTYPVDNSDLLEGGIYNKIIPFV